MSASVTNWIISLTLWLFTCKISSCTTSRDFLSNVWWQSLDVVQEDISYVKSHKVREIIQFLTYTVISHCLTSRDLHVLHLETCQQCLMTVSVTNWIVSLTLWLFIYKISSCTTSRDLPSNVWWLYKWETELSPMDRNWEVQAIQFLTYIVIRHCWASL
jgi:hypothetical protein